jgi:hypothetical protein
MAPHTDGSPLLREAGLAFRNIRAIDRVIGLSGYLMCIAAGGGKTGPAALRPDGATRRDATRAVYKKIDYPAHWRGRAR